MAREIDEAWIDEAIDRYRGIEARQAELDRAARAVEVTVRSADGTVEVVVTADGTVQDVRIPGQPPEVARAVREAVTAASDAAAWARQKLHSEAFGAYRPLT
jgi:hypothetical protein